MRDAAHGEILTPGVRIMISQNSIFSNGDIGIDLGEQGVTPNHPEDPNTEEANEGQNFPEFIPGTDNQGQPIMQGKLAMSKPNKDFTIEIFSTSECARQGRQLIKSIFVRTDSKGDVTFNVALPAAISGGFINATATDPDGNTSEFSNCAPLSPRLIRISVTSNLVAAGSGFEDPVQVSILDKDNQGNTRELTFSEQAKLKKGGTKVVQNGRVILPDRTSISLEEAIPPGKLVQIRFRNGNGTETAVRFKK